jgi:hypothetical protein
MPVARRELVLDHGRVFIEVPRLMTDDELAVIFEAFVNADMRWRGANGMHVKTRSTPP